MKLFQNKKEQPQEVTPVENKKSMKWFVYAVGTIVGIAHIGVLGHLIKPTEPSVQQPPTLNIPQGPYSSYKIRAGKDGYEIEFRADDPKVLESQRSLSTDSNKKGFFGGGTKSHREWRRDQFTREGTRNLGGATGEEGKLSAKEAECLVADAGARSQGAMAGSAITAGVVVPAVMNIPYIGWLAAGWATLLGQQAGSSLGSQVGTVFNDC